MTNGFVVLLRFATVPLHETNKVKMISKQNVDVPRTIAEGNYFIHVEPKSGKVDSRVRRPVVQRFCPPRFCVWCKPIWERLEDAELQSMLF
jgi:hypothetical protein